MTNKNPDIYLTSNLKTYYANDFTNNVLTCSDSFWKLSPDIVEILNAINQNENVQTLYSHKKQFDKIDINDSSLTFTYTKEIELKIFREIVPYLLACFSTVDDSKFSYLFYHPEIKDTSGAHNVCNLASVVDGNYFNVNRLWFNLSSDKKEIHDKFWDDLKNKLGQIKP
jgi:hypothetical protein